MFYSDDDYDEAFLSNLECILLRESQYSQSQVGVQSNQFDPLTGQSSMMAFTAAEAADSVMMSCEIKELGMSSEIVKLLECPVCRGVPMAPIWNCMNGHIACDQCKTRMDTCGICRERFRGGRNYFMEAVVADCTLTCPYADDGCKAVFKGNFMKNHAAECKFGPKIKWIACQDRANTMGFPSNAIRAGQENGVSLYIIRGPHAGSVTPGKLFEYRPPGVVGTDALASLPWGGGEHFKYIYEVLTAPSDEINWIPSQNGVQVPNAIIGGRSEDDETLYIGRFTYENNLICGKIHPSHKCCYIGVRGREIASQSYEILVKVDPPRKNELVENNNNRMEEDDLPAYFS